MTSQLSLATAVGLLLFAVSANAQLNPATQAVVNQAVAKQLSIDAQAYGFSCGVQPVVSMWQGCSPSPGINCVEPDGSCAWGCNIGGAAFVNEGKCISSPGPVAGESTLQCLEEAASHEVTEACYGGSLCDARKAQQWVVDGFELADCDYPGPSTAPIGGCQDLQCFVDATQPQPSPGPTPFFPSTPEPTPAPPAAGGCSCPPGSFPFGNGCFLAGSWRFFSCSAFGPPPTPQPTPAPTPMPPVLNNDYLLNLASLLCKLSFPEAFCQ